MPYRREIFVPSPFLFALRFEPNYSFRPLFHVLEPGESRQTMQFAEFTRRRLHNLQRRLTLIRAFLAALVGVASWRIIGKPGFLAMPLFTFALWAMIRWSTPAEGTIQRRLSSRVFANRFFAFLLVWLLVAGVGLMAHSVLERCLACPSVALTVGVVLWFAVRSPDRSIGTAHVVSIRRSG